MIRVSIGGKPFGQRIRSVRCHLLHGRVELGVASVRTSDPDERTRRHLRLTVDEKTGVERLVELDPAGAETVLWERER